MGVGKQEPKERTVTLPGFMEAIISLLISRGAFLPGMSAVVMMISTSLHCFANRSCATSPSRLEDGRWQSLLVI